MKNCKICNKEFIPIAKASKYCSDECRKEGHYQNRTKWRSQKEVKPRWSEYTKKWRSKNYALSRFIVLRSKAKKNGIDFDIEFEDLIIPELCPVLQIPLDGHDRDHQWSFDKIVPEKGYVKGNVKIISMRANRLKNNATIPDLEKIIKYIRNNT